MKEEKGDTSQMRCRIRVRLGDRELEVEGDRDFVEKSLNLHSQLIESQTLSLPVTTEIIANDSNGASETEHASSPASPRTNGRSSRIPLTSFVRQSGARTSRERALVIGAYLYLHRGMETFSRGDIERCYQEALLPKSSNVSRDINRNRENGFFDYAGKEPSGAMTFYITQDGLEAVKKMSE